METSKAFSRVPSMGNVLINGNTDGLTRATAFGSL